MMPEREGYWWGCSRPGHQCSNRHRPLQHHRLSMSGVHGGFMSGTPRGRNRCAGRRKPKGKYDNFDKKSQGSLVHFGKVNVLHPSNTQRDAHCQL
jgi:hypothetical protein